MLVRLNFLLFTFIIIILLSHNNNNHARGGKVEKQSSVAGTCPYNRHEIRKRETEAAAFAESLYEATDPILQLGVTNFDDEVFNKKNRPKAHLVEFYLSWCGHCRHFAPFYVRFADDVKPWKSLVEVAAINCALDYNRDLCDSNRVEMVPYMRYFERNAKKYEDARVGVAHRSAGQLRHQLIDFLVREYETHNYLDWPSFKYLGNVSKVSEAWADVPAETKHLILIFERPSIDNYTAIETVLDIYPHYPNIVVKRVKDDHPFADDWDVVDFPSLAILARGDDIPIHLSELRRMMVGDILGKLALGPSFGEQANVSRPILVDAPTTRAPGAQSTTPETPESRKSKFYVSETDLLLSTHYALNTEIPYISKNITGSNFTALVRFVDTLRKYFPKSRDVKDVLKFLTLPTGEELPRSDRARRYFSDLYDYLASKNNSGNNAVGPSITSNEWKQKLVELEGRHDNPFPKSSTWQHCRGSRWKYRGYTCGLWSLFHTLTIHAYLEDGLKPGFDPFAVLRAVKGYVGTFFGCTYCSRHFIEMVTGPLKMEDYVKYSSDVVMYLWRAHNTVNKRLAGDSTEDPVFPKRQFPPDFLCEDCQRKQQQHDQQQQQQQKKDQQQQSPDWDYRNVLRFLVRYYTNIRPHKEVSGADAPTTTNNTSTPPTTTQSPAPRLTMPQL